MTRSSTCWGGWSSLWCSCFVGVAGQAYGPVVLLGWLVKLMVQLFCWGGWSSLWSSSFVGVAGQAYGPVVLLGWLVKLMVQ